MGKWDDIVVDENRKWDDLIIDEKEVMKNKIDELSKEILETQTRLCMQQDFISKQKTEIKEIQAELKKQKIKNQIMYVCILLNTISILILALKS